MTGPHHHGAPHRGASVSEPPPWLVTVATCPSTNTWALEHLTDLPHGSVIYTAQQTAGLGQRERRWLSPAGVLTASFVLRLDAAAAGPHLSLAAGLAVAHCVEDLDPDAGVALKWPNDCYCHHRKLAGVLCEARLQQTQLTAVIGIGLNVAPHWDAGDQFPGLTAPPIALSDLGIADPGHLWLLTTLRRYLLEAVGMLRAGRWEGIADELRRRDYLRDRRCAVTVHDAQLTGTGAGIDSDGRLLLALDTGGHRAIDSGTVSLLPAAGDDSTPTPKQAG